MLLCVAMLMKGSLSYDRPRLCKVGSRTTPNKVGPIRYLLPCALVFFWNKSGKGYACVQQSRGYNEQGLPCRLTKACIGLSSLHGICSPIILFAVALCTVLYALMV